LQPVLCLLIMSDATVELGKKGCLTLETFLAATWSEFFANYKSAINCHRNALTTLK